MIAVWIAIAVLALGAFGLAMLFAGEGRQVWTLLASALVFALAGYAWQGSPGLPDEPRQASLELSPTGDALIETRRAFYSGEGMLPARYVITADGFSRRGQHVDAAGLLRNGIDEDPTDGEAWLALGIALAEHTRGRVTPPVAYAFQRAREESPGSPAPAYFQGLVALRSGQLGEARDFWAQALKESSKDARGREYVAQQLERLNGVISVLGERQGQPAMPPSTTTPAPNAERGPAPAR